MYEALQVISGNQTVCFEGDDIQGVLEALAYAKDGAEAHFVHGGGGGIFAIVENGYVCIEQARLEEILGWLEGYTQKPLQYGFPREDIDHAE